MKKPNVNLPKKLRAMWDDAHDFDPNDPLVGLTAKEMSGPVLSRRATLRLLAAGGVLTTAHLLPGGLTSQAEAAGATGGTLKCGWAGVAEIQTLDPIKINQVLEFQITSNVLSGLMHIDNTLVARGDLAESWTVSDDGKVYEFKLRKGVTFHNGDAFTADDVVYTFNRSSDKTISTQTKTIANVEKVEKIDDYTVRFTLKAPQASFLTKTLERSSGRAMTIVCKGAIEKMGASAYGLAPVGTGPFKVTSHVMGQGVTLEKFADYYDPERPKLDKVTITPIVGVEPLAAALEAGDIQFIGGNPVPSQLIDRFKANADLSVEIMPGPGFQSVWLNPWRDPMKVTDFNKPMEELKKDKGFMVRLALAKALDRELFVKQGLFGYGVPAYGSINPAMAYYYDNDIAKTSEEAYDPEGARKLLADAGYPGGKGFPELELSTTPGGKRLGLVIANIYKTVLGISVKLVTQEFSVGIENFDKMDFDLWLSGSGGDYDPDDGLIDWMITDSKFNGPTRDKSKYPFGYFSDAEVDKLSAEQTVTADIAKRKELVQKANKITSDKVTCAFLYHPVDVLVYAKSVNVPKASMIPGLRDLDRITLS